MLGITNASGALLSGGATTQYVDNKTAAESAIAYENAKQYTDAQIKALKGLPLTITNEKEATLSWNSEIHFSNITGEVNIVLPDSPDYTQTYEIRIAIKFTNEDKGQLGVKFHEKPDQKVIFPEGEPTWTKNKLYTISLKPYASGGKVYIIGYIKEITLS